MQLDYARIHAKICARVDILCRRDLNAYTLDLKIDRVNRFIRLSRILYIVIFASKCVPVIMVALCNRADHYIFAL